MKVDAPAKINLFLSVGARRPDGLHDIVSVMQAVSLADSVELAPAEGVTLRVEPPGAAPDGEPNVAARAARAFAAAHGIETGAAIAIHKRIPVGAGLGGGSADAAATLVGLNELWGTRVSRKALERVGAAVGADVPFCVAGGTALVRGAGESLSPLPVRRPLWWVIGVPPLPLSTAEVYAALDSGAAPALDDPWELADGLARGDLERIAGALRNDLQVPALTLGAPGEHGGEALRDAGALGAQLTGSGSAWIGLAVDEEHARAVAAAASGAFARVEVVRSLDRGPRIVER